MSNERREYFRVKDQVTLEYRVITEVEMECVLLRIRDEVPDRFTAAASFAGTSWQMKHLLQNLSNESPELALCLQTLDKKLNLLAQLLVAETMNTQGACLREVSLSAGGMAFNAERELKHGELLETRLVLFPSVTGILAVGQVVSCERRGDVNGGMPWRVAVEYRYIRESDRDLLVKHLLTREAEMLRARRESEG
ncbi:MAG: PilZ domain-containing protein [Gammaproteobacteria bacterium]|nr:PilZ domain-containing protein [Gammaproteobacteria bacterium]